MSEFKRNINFTLKAVKNVNIRQDVPEIATNNLKGVLHKGFSVNLVEEWRGENHTEDGITSDKWYRDKNEDFYWSGGLEFKKASSVLETNNFHWWIKDYSIAKIWDKYGRGDGVKIAILDTGIDIAHPNLKDSIDSSLCKNFIQKKTSVNDFDGHGTHCAGIICSNGLNNVWGIAPEARVCSGKIVKSKRSGINADILAKAINWYKDKVDIISISVGLPKQVDNSLYDAVKSAVNQHGCIITAAIGNKEEEIYGEYPASYSEVISVGAIDKDRTLTPKLLKYEGLNITCPGFEILSTSKNSSFLRKTGSSQATPYISGFIALMLESNNNLTGSECIDIIKNESIKTELNGYSYNILTPLKTMDSL